MSAEIWPMRKTPTAPPHAAAAAQIRSPMSFEREYPVGAAKLRDDKGPSGTLAGVGIWNAVEILLANRRRAGRLNGTLNDNFRRLCSPAM